MVGEAGSADGKCVAVSRGYDSVFGRGERVGGRRREDGGGGRRKLLKDRECKAFCGDSCGESE